MNVNHSLRNLFENEPTRSERFSIHREGILFDFSRQLISQSEFVRLMTDVSDKVLPDVKRMFLGENVNFTEKRPVLHMALRAHQNDMYEIGCRDVVDDVHRVLYKIQDFSKKIQEGEFRSSCGKPFKNIIAIGIGGSYLGVEFVHNAIQNDKLMNLRFITNVDPCDFNNCVRGLDASETLVIIVSKTFTTQETMINADTVKSWLLSNIDRTPSDIVKHHMIAVSSNVEKVYEYGIDQVFGFWDWVGGRFSTWSAVGILPLSLVYGYSVMEEFLDGGRDADNHFRYIHHTQNIPMILGALSIHNIQSGRNVRAVLPYSQALNRFPAHIQQLEMESNGKTVNQNGHSLNKTGEIIIGEPGTNAQHSFYQLLHQGTTSIPCEFIGFCKQRHNVKIETNSISNHDELMCNVFAQMDALAFGKNKIELEEELCPSDLLPYKTFDGNRPSLLLLFDELTPRNIGYLMSIYEHRTAVIGFYLGINSFDQWGVELGKQLATKIKHKMEGNDVVLNNSTENMLKFYFDHRNKQSSEP